jgi:hypothetical protein
VTARSGSSARRRNAFAPTSTVPSRPIHTALGVIRRPSSFASKMGNPESTPQTAEFVVPKIITLIAENPCGPRLARQLGVDKENFHPRSGNETDPVLPNAGSSECSLFETVLLDDEFSEIALPSITCQLPPMSTITLSLLEEDLVFLRKLSKAQGTSAEELLARQARNLRRRMEAGLPVTFIAATGIIAADMDVETEMGEHLERKHR